MSPVQLRAPQYGRRLNLPSRFGAAGDAQQWESAMALSDNDEDALRKPVSLQPLDPMSVAELEGYIASLEQEIARVRAAIEAKRAVRGGAEAIFKR